MTCPLGLILTNCTDIVLFFLTDHAEFLHELPDAEMVDLLPTAKKVAQAIGCKEYNVLQNNGRLAHQVEP